MFDVIIIGAGVVGSMLARELMRYKLDVCLLEKEADVAMGASKANSGIIHGGYDPEPGTLKAEMNVKGLPLLFEAARELGVPYRKNGSLVLAFDGEEHDALVELKERGIINKAPATFLLTGDEARKMEPALSAEVNSALWVPEAGIICPYMLTIAAAGNAMDNGATLIRSFKAVRVEKGEAFTVYAEDGRSVEGRYLVNCAGVRSDEVAGICGDGVFNIIPRSGEYMVLDKNEGKTVDKTVFQVPTKNGKGILVTPTADGNLLVGPTAEEVPDKEANLTHAERLEYVGQLAKKSVPNVNLGAVITSFAGTRASVKGGDFIIEASKTTDRLVHVAAIDSPGLTSCVAIAHRTIEILHREGLKLRKNRKFNPYRENVHAFRNLSDAEKDAFIKAHPAYGRIICRCELVSEGEILDALTRNPVALDVDGVKRRTRAGMGRCQGGFCLPYVMRLIAERQGCAMEEVTKFGRGSKLLEEDE